MSDIFIQVTYQAGDSQRWSNWLKQESIECLDSLSECFRKLTSWSRRTSSWTMPISGECPCYVIGKKGREGRGECLIEAPFI